MVTKTCHTLGYITWTTTLQTIDRFGYRMCESYEINLVLVAFSHRSMCTINSLSPHQLGLMADILCM